MTLLESELFTPLWELVAQLLALENGDAELLSLLQRVKNKIIGSPRAKREAVEAGITNKLTELVEEATTIELRKECITILASLAADKFFPSRNITPTLVATSLEKWPELTLWFAVETGGVELDQELTRQLLPLLRLSTRTRISACELLAATAQSHQTRLGLLESEALPELVELLQNRVTDVRLAAVNAITALVCPETAHVLSQYHDFRGSLVEQLNSLLRSSEPMRLRVAAANTVITLRQSGCYIPAVSVITHSVIPTLITAARLMGVLDLTPVLVATAVQQHEDHVEPLILLDRLLTEDVPLQIAAGDCRQLVRNLLLSLHWTLEHAIISPDTWLAAALNLLGTLASADETLRQRIFPKGPVSLGPMAVLCLNSATVEVQLAAVRCLLSASRSVLQLSTTFREPELLSSLNTQLFGFLQSPHLPLLRTTLALLANLALEFSPLRAQLLLQLPDQLAPFLEYQDFSVKLTTLWTLANFTYNAEEDDKKLVAEVLKPDVLQRLLSPNEDPAIVEKTLSLVRNLLHEQQGISLSVLPSVMGLVENSNTIITEQALCVIANAVADFNFNWVDLQMDLAHVLNFGLYSNVLGCQLAAVQAITNFAWDDIDNTQALEKKTLLDETGVSHRLIELSEKSDNETLVNAISMARARLAILDAASKKQSMGN